MFAQKSLRTTPPTIMSYDSGHEHSVEHWIELAQLVEDAVQQEAEQVLELVS